MPRYGTIAVAVALLTLAASTGAGAGTGGLRFQDRTSESGIPETTSKSWGGSWFDFDLDSWSDLLMSRHLRPPWFAANRIGFYTEIHSEELVTSPDGRSYYDRHNCAWGEANHDGRPDLVCVSGAQSGRGTGSNQLLLQRSTGELVERGALYGIQDRYGRGRSVNWFDFDRDGKLDLFVGNTYRPGYPNVLFRRVRGGFKKVGRGLAEEMVTDSSSIADWNADRWTDLIVVGPETRLYKNKRGRFKPVRMRGISGRSWNSASWGDFNGDGWPDLALVNGRRLRIFRNTGHAFRSIKAIALKRGRTALWTDADNNGVLDLYVVQGAAHDPSSVNRADFFVIRKGGRFAIHRDATFRGRRNGSGEAVATADSDRDGRLDLFITNGHQRTEGAPQLLRNVGRSRNWIKISLRGTPANPLGYGATVRLKTRRRVYRRQVTDGVTYRMQSDVGSLHMGIGGADRAAIRIRWPGGVTDCVRGIPAGSDVTITKGRHPCRR